MARLRGFADSLPGTGEEMTTGVTIAGNTLSLPEHWTGLSNSASEKVGTPAILSGSGCNPKAAIPAGKSKLMASGLCVYRSQSHKTYGCVCASSRL